MCGIVGYWGPVGPKKVIIDGLRRLEYRGYDSTGVAIFNQKTLQVLRSPGKLAALEERLKGIEFSGPSGIGHTRWATHGVPNERNAHPHKVGPIAIVHNGIIENYAEIREMLIRRGDKINSDTDSELIAHLLNDELKSSKGLLEATVKLIPKLKGAYSILVINENEPDTLVAFKSGTPMVVGLGEKEVIIASDVQAIIEHTKRVIYLDDGEIVCTQKNSAKFYDIHGKPLDKKPVTLNWSTQMAEKQGFDHFMQKEIFEQPRALRQTLEPHVTLNPYSVNVKDLGLSESEIKDISRIQLIACGTSWHAALVSKYVFERLTKIPTDVDIASEFRYRDPILDKKTLVIAVSQSGETADTLAGLRLCKQQGLKTLAICNVPHSSIDRESHGHFYTQAGPEIGVASTKAFTAQILSLHLLALHFGRIRGSLNADQISSYTQDLIKVPSQVEVCLNHDKWFKEAAEDLAKYKGFLYLGRGICFPVALEGALKLKEITYLHAEGYPSGELKHGPIALVEPTMAIIAMCPQDDLYEKNVSNIEEVRARGGPIISIGTENDHTLEKLSLHFLSIPKAGWLTNPLLSAIPIQLLSYHLAVALGRDVDQPRNLAKSVTVE